MKKYLILGLLAFIIKSSYAEIIKYQKTDKTLLETLKSLSCVPDRTLICNENPHLSCTNYSELKNNYIFLDLKNEYIKFNHSKKLIKINFESAYQSTYDAIIKTFYDTNTITIRLHYTGNNVTNIDYSLVMKNLQYKNIFHIEIGACQLSVA